MKTFVADICLFLVAAPSLVLADQAPQKLQIFVASADRVQPESSSSPPIKIFSILEAALLIP